MFDISISSYGRTKTSNRRASTISNNKRKKLKDQIIFVGDKKYLLNGNCYNDGFKYKEIIKQPAKCVYEG